MVFGCFASTADELYFLSVSRLGCGRLFVRLLRPFLVFRGFRRQRFGLFCSCGFAAFFGRFEGLDPAGVSVFSALRLTRL